MRVVRVRVCTREGCDTEFEDRGAGSGIKRGLCSLQCERLEQQSKANSALRERQARQQRTRAGVDESSAPAPRRYFERQGNTKNDWKARVLELYGFDCLSCGKPAQHGHHIVARSVIMAAAHLEFWERAPLEYDATNGFPICVRCHEKHEHGVERLYFEMLPAPAVEWAVAHGFSRRVFNPTIYLGAPALPTEEAA